MKKVANYVAFALILLAFASMLVKPTPPGPGPGPVKGMRIAFVNESSKGFPTQDMADAWNSVKVEDWLVSHCEGGAEGRRRWDKDIDVSKETEIWKAIWEDAKPKMGNLPQILVTGQKGKGPQEGKWYPFPKNTDELLKFLETTQGGK